jgi:TRAP-type C4-dicarboxylate transport system permease small subunit
MSAPRPAFSGLLDRLEQLSLAGAAISLVAIALLQAWQVFGRYVLNASPGWTEPVALVLMGFVVMLGAAVAVRQESHFRFGMIAEGGSPRRQAVLAVLSRGVAAITGLMLAVYGAHLTLDEWDVPMAGAGIPGGTRFLGLAIGGVLILIFAAERLAGGGPAPAEGDD